jgi:hypothetical protein
MHTTLRRSTVLAFTIGLTALVAAPAGAAPKDSKLAQRGVLVASDMPSSWTSGPPENSSDAQIERAAAAIPDCTTYLAVRKANKSATHAESRTYSDGTTELSNEVWVFPSIGKAKKVFADMESSTIAPCLTTLFQQLLEADLADDPSVASVTVDIDQSNNLSGLEGDDTVAYGGPATALGTDGSSDRFLMANFAVRSGRAILSFSVFGPPTANGSFQPEFIGPGEDAINGAVLRIQRAQ